MAREREREKERKSSSSSSSSERSKDKKCREKKRGRWVDKYRDGEVSSSLVAFCGIRIANTGMFACCCHRIAGAHCLVAELEGEGLGRAGGEAVSKREEGSAGSGG
jgi:hypothetical protein